MEVVSSKQLMYLGSILLQVAMDHDGSVAGLDCYKYIIEQTQDVSNYSMFYYAVLWSMLSRFRRAQTGTDCISVTNGSPWFSMFLYQTPRGTEPPKECEAKRTCVNSSSVPDTPCTVCNICTWTPDTSPMYIRQSHGSVWVLHFFFSTVTWDA